MVSTYERVTSKNPKVETVQNKSVPVFRGISNLPYIFKGKPKYHEIPVDIVSVPFLP